MRSTGNAEAASVTPCGTESTLTTHPLLTAPHYAAPAAAATSAGPSAELPHSAAPLRHYILSALHLIRPLFNWLPTPANSPTTALATAVAAAVADTRGLPGAVSAAFTFSGGAANVVGFEGVSKSNCAAAEVQRAAEVALDRALAILAHECFAPTVPPTARACSTAAAGAPTATSASAAATFFAPDLTGTQRPGTHKSNSIVSNYDPNNGLSQQDDE